MAISVVALKERDPAETRVALTPDVVAALVKKGASVFVEKGAGDTASHPDSEYVAAGAKLVTAAQALDKADILAVVRRPAPATLTKLRKGQVVLGLLDSFNDAKPLETAAGKGVVPICLTRLPRKVSRAQTMDALSSQSSIAGYRAVIVAAEAYDRYFPMMITAAGTAKPATVLVLGAGVAGLQAIGTARRLGAQVTAYDVRPTAREEVTSLGAQFLDAGVADAAGEGGYARELTKAEAAAQQKALADKIAKFDVVITTAKVPGRKPPLLVTKDSLAKMKPGTVVVDLAASALGGNVAGSKPDATVVANGVTIIGAGNIESGAAAGASAAYARNVAAVIAAIAPDGEIVLDPEDEVIDAMWIRPKQKGAAS